MKIPGIPRLDKTLALEIIALTVVMTTGLSSIMIMAKLPRYAEYLFSAPDVPTTLLMVLLYTFPNILKLTVPISLFMACSTVVMRMSTDRELEAWFACGVNVLRLAITPCLLGVGVMFISLFSALYLEPYSIKQFDKFRWLQTRSLIEGLLKNSLHEKSFTYDIFSAGNINLAIYFDKSEKNQTQFSNVFMAHSSNHQPYSSLVYAKRGELHKETVNGYPDFIFTLSDGNAYSLQESPVPISQLLKENPNAYQIEKGITFAELGHYPQPADWSITQFTKMNVSLVNAYKNKFKLESSMPNQAAQLYPSEYIALLEKEKNASENWRRDEGVISKYLFFLRQISLPLSSLFLPILGVCLGIIDPRRKHISVYFGMGIVIFSLYASISLCQQLAMKFIISPFLILFLPSFVLLCILLFVLHWRLKHPPSLSFVSYLKEDLFRFLFKTRSSS